MPLELFTITSYTTHDGLRLRGHYINHDHYSHEIECQITEVDLVNERFKCEPVAAGGSSTPIDIEYYAPWSEMDMETLLCSFVTKGYDIPSIRNIDVSRITNGVNMMDYALLIKFPRDIATRYSYVYKGYFDPTSPSGRYFERKPTLFRHHDIHSQGIEEAPSERIMTFAENVLARMRRNREASFRTSNTTFNWGIEDLDEEEMGDQLPIGVSDMFVLLMGRAAEQQRFEDVNVRLLTHDFKKICGVKKDNGSYCYRKMGSKFIEDMKITERVECAICSDEIKRWSKVAVTPCKHLFHADCARKWFTEMCQRPTCPNCRHDIRTPV